MDPNLKDEALEVSIALRLLQRHRDPNVVHAGAILQSFILRRSAHYAKTCEDFMNVMNAAQRICTFADE